MIKLDTIFQGIKERCYNQNSPAYSYYGARGIKCEWDSFEEFYKDMGEKPEGKSLDRIDNNGNYCKENCRWSTAKEQAINRRSTTWITFQGETLNQRQWAKKLNISYKTLNNRIKVRKWSLDKVLTQPLRKMINNRKFVER